VETEDRRPTRLLTLHTGKTPANADGLYADPNPYAGPGIALSGADVPKKREGGSSDAIGLFALRRIQARGESRRSRTSPPCAKRSTGARSGT
jgi:hypothetical protein